MFSDAVEVEIFSLSNGLKKRKEHLLPHVQGGGGFCKAQIQHWRKTQATASYLFY